MTVKVKITLTILIAILLGGAGYFFIVNKSKPKVLPPVNITPQTEEIDTSNWQTYRNETLGFEIKYPNTWKVQFEYKGPNVFFVKDIKQVVFLSEDSDTERKMQLEIIAIEDEVLPKEADIINGENIVVAGLSARISKMVLPKIGDNNSPPYREAIVLKANDKYYKFGFLTQENNVQGIKIWHAILETFNLITK